MEISTLLPSPNISSSANGLQQQVAVAVMGNSLESAENLGNGMAKMLEQSVTPNLGQNIDYSV